MRLRERDAGGVRCPYCRDGIGAEVPPCAGCGVRLHPACAAEAGRCPTLGCGVQVEAPRPAARRAAPRRAPEEAERGEAQRRPGPDGSLGPLVPAVGVCLLALAVTVFGGFEPVVRFVSFSSFLAFGAVTAAQLVATLRRRRFLRTRLHYLPYPGREGQPLELTLTVPAALRELARADPSLVLRAELRNVRRLLPRGVDHEDARGEQAPGHVAWRSVLLVDARHLREGRVTFTFVPPRLGRGWDYGWELSTICEVPGPDFVETWDLRIERD